MNTETFDSVRDSGAIVGRLRQSYQRFGLLCVLLFFFIVVLLWIISQYTVETANTMSHAVKFYNTLEQLHVQLRMEVQTKSEEMKEQFQREDAGLMENLTALEELEIGGNYARNMSDRFYLLERYLDIQSQILGDDYTNYKKLDQIYRTILAQRSILFDELNEYFSEQKSRTRQRSFGMGAVLLLVITGAAFLIWKSTDEVSELKRSLQLAEEHKDREMERLRMQNRLVASELKCLQMQVNPHFLFNTLNMIQQTLYLDKKEKTSELLKETADYLRYCLDYTGKNISLQKELEGLGNYINLQEARLGRRIRFEFDLDERLGSLQVPCLILQPLVENSIIHGVGGLTERAVVQIRTRCLEEEHQAEITVQDNGRGMDPGELRILQKSLLETDGEQWMNRIGLHNVARRLSMTQEGANLTVGNTPDGFLVKILIPTTPVKEFPSPDLRCEAGNSLVNPFDSPEVCENMEVAADGASADRG